MRRLLGSVLLASLAPAQHVLVEAEAFADHGGWSLDTQFAAQMGSPYLLAHGLGRPVADATTSVSLPGAGRYRVWVRTFDWVARWRADGAPGRFRVAVDGAWLSTAFGIDGADWDWHDGGVIAVDGPQVALALRDETGFDGRCDAILLTRDLGWRPPADGPELAALRGAPVAPTTQTFDLVVVGGGYGGMAAAVAAARMGCRVALVQDRPVLGGNGSSEVRVWSKGGIRRGHYPRLGEIVAEFADQATSSPGSYEEFGDAHKEAWVRAEPNVTLFLHHRADGVRMEGDRIVAVDAFDVRSGVRRRFAAPLFADCTGHGWIGAWAGADATVRATQHLGASNMWRWQASDQPQAFPSTPWALPLALDDFPYPNGGKGEWFWESGFDLHPIDDLEAVRDWNLRAVFGAFQAMKSGARAAEHRTARLTWVAFVSGTRESRQLLGDVVLTRDDIVGKREFADGCVPTTWDIDLHYPRERYARGFPTNPFISRAHFDRSVDRQHGYPVPYRCFYSRNIANLLFAGRAISVTHELGTVRVMRTGGMVGEVVGKAASLCVLHGTSPRGVYEDHLAELLALLRLPGRARRANVTAPIVVPPPPPGRPDLALDEVPGIVVDDVGARLQGDWTEGRTLAGFVGDHYLYDGNSGKGSKSATFTLRPRLSGRYRVELAWRSHDNRAKHVPVVVRTKASEQTVFVDQTRSPAGVLGFQTLLELDLDSGAAVLVIVSNAGTDGQVCVDAARLLGVAGGAGK